MSHFFCGSNDFIWCILSSCRLLPAIRRHLSDADPFVNPTDKANIFAFCFLIMLIMNLLHLAAMQKFLFVVNLILHCLYLMSWLFCSTLILQRGLVLMEYSLYSKNLAPQINISITYILNKSLNDGFFQSKWKDCNLKLTPVFKSDQKDVSSTVVLLYYSYNLKF